MQITDFQPIINMTTSIIMVSFPIALVLMIAQKLCGIMVSFIFGKEVNF